MSVKRISPNLFRSSAQLEAVKKAERKYLINPPSEETLFPQQQHNNQP